MIGNLGDFCFGIGTLLVELSPCVLEVIVSPVASNMEPRTFMPGGIDRIRVDDDTCWPRTSDMDEYSSRRAPCVRMPVGAVDMLTIVKVPRGWGALGLLVNV